MQTENAGEKVRKGLDSKIKHGRSRGVRAGDQTKCRSMDGEIEG